MENLLLGKIIKNEVEKIESQFRGLINSVENFCNVSYEYDSNNGRIKDKFIIEIVTIKDDDTDNIFQFETSSLSLIYIDEISKLINDTIKCEFNTIEEYHKEFNNLHNSIKGFYAVELIKVSIRELNRIDVNKIPKMELKED